MSPELDSGHDTRQQRKRLAGAVAIAALAGLYVLLRGNHSHLSSDFDQLWYGSRAVLRGVSPYQVVGRGRELDWDLLYYPMPAVVLVTPLAFLPLMAARICFAAVTAGVLAYAVQRDSPARLLLFASTPALIAIGRGQYVPLLLAAAYLPALMWIGAVKPNIGLALAPLAKPLRRGIALGIAGATLLVLVSFLLQPGWFTEWRWVLSRRRTISTPVILQAGGFGLLLALLRWRRRETWMLLALASVPQTSGFYDTLLLFAVPKGLRQTALLAIGSNLAFLGFLATWQPARKPPGALEALTAFWLLLGLYLPSLWFLLRQPESARNPVIESPPSTRADRFILVLLAVSALFVLWALLSRYHI